MSANSKPTLLGTIDLQINAGILNLFDLTVEKVIDGYYTDDESFTIEIFEAGDTQFESPVKAVTFDSESEKPWSETFEDLLEGDYIIRETNNTSNVLNYYTLTASRGTIDPESKDCVNLTLDGDISVTLTNTRNELDSRNSLTISKELAGFPTVWSVDGDTPFTAYVKNSENQFLTFSVSGSVYTYTGTDITAGTPVIFSKNDDALLKNIPVGMVCTVTEDPDTVSPARYSTRYETASETAPKIPGNTVIITQNTNKQVIVTNNFIDSDSSLIISKAPAENVNDAYWTAWNINNSYEFTAKVMNSAGKFLLFTVDTIDNVYTYAGTDDTGTEIKFSIVKNATLKGIPVGMVCTVTENPDPVIPAKYTAAYETAPGISGDTVTIGRDAHKKITVTNTFAETKSDLIISKAKPAGEVNDENWTAWKAGDATVFKATVINGDGKYLLFDSGNKYAGTDESEGTIIEFSINNPAVLKNIPLGMVCTVEEIADSYTPQRYSAAYDNNEVTMTYNQDKTVTVINTYIDFEEMLPVDVILTAEKQAVNGTLRNNQFTFGVFDSTNKQVASARNTADGTITFSAIQLNEAGDYAYTIKETSLNSTNWTVDKNVYSVTVSIIETAGVLSIDEINYQNDESPTFINTYKESEPFPPDEPSTTTTEEPTTETTDDTTEDDTGTTTEDGSEEETTEDIGGTTDETTTEPTVEDTTDDTTEDDTGTTTESTIDETTTERQTGTTETSTEPTIGDTTESTTETATTSPTEPQTTTGANQITVVLPDGIVLILEVEDMEWLETYAIPLSNGWFAVDLDEDSWWEIFSEHGVPLGVVFLPDVIDIAELDIEFIILNLIPISNVITAEKPVENPRDNPPTGDSIYAIFGLLMLTVIGAVIFKKKKSVK